VVVVRRCDRSLGGITVGRVRAELQRSCWGIKCIRHLGDCFL